MSCVPGSMRIFSSRTGKFFLFFLILWFLVALFLVAHTLLLKGNIQRQQVQSIERALTGYLEKNNSPASSRFSLQNSIPHEVDFIRLVKGKDQLLVTGTNNMAFTGLVELDPSAHGAWINLNYPEKSGNWLLISRKLSDGVMIQAGKDDSSTGIAMYRQSITISYWIFFFTALPCLGLALLFTDLTRAPLRSLQDTITQALDEKSLTLPQSHNANNDLTSTYQLLEQIFSQNRHLIAEMQSSLDNVAHDLRTPMTRLRAVAEYALQSDKEDPLIYRNALSDCLEESERVLAMLKVMMSVAEAESGTMLLETRSVDVVKTLEDVIALYQYIAEEEQITVSCKGQEGIIIPADKTRISQVWANLLDNAIKYGRQSGKIIITVEKSDGQAVIRFCDDGMGISETEINRIWDRLYRGDRSRTKQGLGLGLNYVKAVVEAHGGQVLVTSKIREGSCFEVRLPLQPSDSVKKVKITD